MPAARTTSKVPRDTLNLFDACLLGMKRTDVKTGQYRKAHQLILDVAQELQAELSDEVLSSAGCDE